MNILFLLPRYSENPKDSTLEKELVHEFRDKGNTVYVSTIREKKENKVTQIRNESGVSVLRIKTGNFRDNVSKIEKGITKVMIPFIFYKNIKKYIVKNKIDLVITSTPAMNSSYLHMKLKKLFSCKVMLIMWDIFPQNAVDLKILKNKFLINNFENKFKISLETSDYITTMSEGNKSFIDKRYPQISKRSFILKNWSKIKPLVKSNSNLIRKKYNLLNDNFICVFGGNIGWLQEPLNLIELAESIKDNDIIKFLFIGSGTEKEKIQRISLEKELKNVIFMERVPREEYEELISSCDLGLISLHRKFTVPNFPSRTTDYFKLGLPILASLDKGSIDDYGKFLVEEAKAGFVGKAGITEELKEKLLQLYNNKELRLQLGKNGRKYYEDNLGVDKAYKTIMNKINGDGFNV